MVKVAIIGASGFTGEKLADLLLGHPEVKITYISAKLDKEVRFSSLFPRFEKKLDLVCENLNLEKAVKKADVFFLALPHTVSFRVAPYLLKEGKIVIDLSADYRIKDLKVYKEYYKVEHQDKVNLKNSVYGLPEFYKERIKKARLLANPGCYPTVSILSIAPLLREGLLKDVIIDAKSGITGAGRKPSLDYHYAHLSGNLFAYRLFGHQHLPEINQFLSEISRRKSQVIFTPHVVPIERGILATIYAGLTKEAGKNKLLSVYNKYYAREPFVRVFENKLPSLKDVIDTNFCDIGFGVSGKKIIIVGVIDNLLKGASGQAVQNMNLILGFDESLGLK
ncbi:MAG: N-acetyl-gamma-glutamyl-phosphate reductase [Candidatus Omnitrophica bacterium]|nr:N-acetyl-gamma-glutamyl-phosphate reductase [Candidatus Omnitrophota bacterium]